MKCPKCGYLGFETTDRCRNCQYDFSLAQFPAEPDLALQEGHRVEAPTADFDLPANTPRPHSPSSPPLDLDRMFGDTEASARPAEEDPAPPPSMTMTFADVTRRSHREPTAARAASELPFDDTALPAAPRAARPPLGVRRTTPEIPRKRARTTRPLKVESALTFGTDTADASMASAGRASADDAATVPMEVPPLGVRVGAGVIDLALLGLIDVIVIFLTLRIAGLEATIEDIRVLPWVPLIVFLALLAFGYVASFTVAGGQTIGKMLLKLRVVGDDGRPVDAAGSVLRAAGCMLVPMTLGASFVPACFGPDHRALHDRLAGTRVVCK